MLLSDCWERRHYSLSHRVILCSAIEDTVGMKFWNRAPLLPSARNGALKLWHNNADRIISTSEEKSLSEKQSRLLFLPLMFKEKVQGPSRSSALRHYT